MEKESKTVQNSNGKVMTRQELLQPRTLEAVFNALQDENNILLGSWRNFNDLESFGYAGTVKKEYGSRDGKALLFWRYYGSSANDNTLEDFKWIIEKVFDETNLNFLLISRKEYYKKAEEFYDKEREKRTMEMNECKRVLKEQVSDEAYAVAEKMNNYFDGRDFIGIDDFDEQFALAIRDIFGIDNVWEHQDELLPNGVSLQDFETDVRGILAYKGWETIFEGAYEGGLENLRVQKRRTNESCRTKRRKRLKESVTIKVDEEDLLDMLMDRVEQFCHYSPNDIEYKLYEDMYQNYIDMGVFENREFSPSIIVDNDYVNYCEIVGPGDEEHHYDEILKLYEEQGLGDVSTEDVGFSYIEAAEEEDGQTYFLCRW